MNLTKNKSNPPKIGLLCHFLCSDITHAVHRIKRFISGQQLKYVAKHVYQIPDSEHCVKALELVRRCSPDYLLNHCLRSYAFGVAMAHKVKQPFDKEVFFMGAIMHDLGLTADYDGVDTFEIEGARAARSFCIDHGVEPENADLIHEMVAHHNSVGIAHKLAPEIALLHYGAGADVAGLWVRDIHQQTLSQVLEEFPRLDFKQGMAALLSDQMTRKPDSYMASMLGLGFLKKIEQTPF